MMISDGFGPASVTMARTFYQFTHRKPYDYPTPLDQIHVGNSRTRSSSSLITDSGAGATAFSCNLKTYNGAIGVTPDKIPCGTVLEAAKHQQRMLTGLVATSRITHATPASFAAHVEQRSQENTIALQEIGENPLGRSLDLMFGGGYCHFLPQTLGKPESCRTDNRNLFEEAKTKYNWTTHMDYEIDRDNATQPSLSDMSAKALDILFKAIEDKEEGFFLMIEGSRIDMAAHSSDAATHLYEILEYQKTIQLVKNYVDQHPDTIMISTSDHETGGLSLARQVSPEYPVYLWYPDVLTRVKSSTIRLAKEIKQMNPDRDSLVNHFLKDKLGITDPTEAELKTLLDAKNGTENNLDLYLADMVSLRAQLGWTTHGHSGVDVNLYAYGAGAELLIGSFENTEVGEFITKALDLNLTDITVQLNSKNASFHLASTTLSEESKLAYDEHLDHYHEAIPDHLKHTVFEP
ncbi:alkaline-phosphatase-like protein [Mycotypha africana]|uniref:alkaline-phosphatase-like protein n=1 Tax=Mycotypha africana TaxID=64632 RepID=UPI0023008C02|nr:alkaline-phosphatase-like protein [Mycotypha africana]KAI8967139.1 alkaline-phosphatase-like protein [Mycotypha africana]